MSSSPDNLPPQPPTDGEDSAQEILGGFPRQLTRQLIEEGDVRRSRRVALAAWLVGAGLAALALAFPQEALVGRGPSLVEAWSRGAAPGEAFTQYWLLRGAAALWGWRLEPAAFLLSALLYGACFPLLAGLGRRVGVSHASAMVATSVVLLSPVAWLAGTTPGPAALGLFCACALLRVLWGGRERGFSSPRRAAAVLWFVAGCGASPVLAWTLPAVALALASPGVEGVRPRAWRSVSYGALCAVALSVAYLVLATPLVFEGLAGASSGAIELGRAAVTSGARGSGALGALLRTLLVVPALGFALLGLAALLFQRRNESEEGPPVWLAFWALVPLAVSIAAGPLRELPFLYLLPLCALGGFDLLGRREGELEARWLPVSLVLTVASLGGALAWIRVHDPLAGWRNEARAHLEPDDLVVTLEREHAYLLRERWGLEVLLLDEQNAVELVEEELAARLEQARGEERRVVLDAPQDRPLPPAAAHLPRLEQLSADGE